MKKLILATVSAIALFGVAACSDTDATKTQSVEPQQTQPAAPSDPAVTPQAPANDAAPADKMKPAEPTPAAPAQ
jgi:PBP1b-binding outer membrane lipoprotein LpoB